MELKRALHGNAGPAAGGPIKTDLIIIAEYGGQVNERKHEASLG